MARSLDKSHVKGDVTVYVYC